jgi:hypothetical protein
VQQCFLTINRHTAKNESIGVWLDINSLDTVIANSVFSNCDLAIYYEISRWGVIVNNKFNKCGRGVWSYSSDVLIAHNLFNQCGQAVIVTGDPRTCNYNIGAGNEGDRSLNVPAAIRNNTIINNKFVDASECNVAIWDDSPSCGGTVCDWNAYIKTFPSEMKKKVTLSAQAHSSEEHQKSWSELHLDRTTILKVWEKLRILKADLLNHEEFPFWSAWGTLTSTKTREERGFDLHSVFIGADVSSTATSKESSSMQSKNMEENPDILREAGREFSPLLSRGKEQNGHPWAVVTVANQNDPGAVTLGGIWHKGRQPLPDIRPLLSINSNIPTPVGPIEKFRDVENCPSFTNLR